MSPRSSLSHSQNTFLSVRAENTGARLGERDREWWEDNKGEPSVINIRKDEETDNDHQRNRELEREMEAGGKKRKVG